jgi:hypothetical protein
VYESTVAYLRSDSHDGYAGNALRCATSFLMPINTYAVDFEAHYSKEVSVRIQGAVNYSSATHIFLVAIYGPDVEYVGSGRGRPPGRGYLGITGLATTQGLTKLSFDRL